METFTNPKAFVENPCYGQQRQESLAALSPEMIDAPIRDLIAAFNQLPFCFTLQCCYGHFVYAGQDDPHNLAALPLSNTLSEVEYRIAYLALCIYNSAPGRMLHDSLKAIAAINPQNIQFGSADWFWERQVNSYVLQVEPQRFKFMDKAMLSYREALSIEKIRQDFFIQLEKVLTGMPSAAGLNRSAL